VSIKVLLKLHNQKKGAKTVVVHEGKDLNEEVVITLMTEVMSRSGVLGYHSGRELLFFGGVHAAQAGGTFSLLLDGNGTRRARGLTAPLSTTKAPGDASLLMKNPPPE
jgi:hypothetical protein